MKPSRVKGLQVRIDVTHGTPLRQSGLQQDYHPALGTMPVSTRDNAIQGSPVGEFPANREFNRVIQDFDGYKAVLKCKIS